MAWFGHSTPAMAAHYCAQAEKKLAQAAGRKWEAATKAEEE